MAEPPVLTVMRFDSSSSPPSPAGKRSVSLTRTVVVTWKRVMHTLRRESQRGVPAGFALINPSSREKPWNNSETSLAAVIADADTEWILI
jgi:hypothetical protein